jgi:hypothetical protein
MFFDDFFFEIVSHVRQVVKVQHGEDDVVQFVGDIEQITPEQVVLFIIVAKK